MSDLADIIDAFIEKHDALREVYFPDDTSCFLLSGDGQTEPFQIKGELSAGWYLKFSEFRGFFRLYYATHEESFARKLKSGGYIAVNGDIYQIRDGDTVPPQGSKPFWKIACEIVGGKKFTSPA